MIKISTTRTGSNGTNRILAAGMLGLILWGGAASLAMAQSSDLQPVLDRLQRLERDIRTLNVQISRGKPSGGTETPALVSGTPETTVPGTAGIARIDARLAELEEELRAGTGRVENMTYELQQINQRLEKLIGDIDYRLSAIESGRGGQPTSPQGSLSQVNAATSPTGVQKVVPGASQPGVLGTLTNSDLGALPPTAGAVQATPVPDQQQTTTSTSVLPSGGPKERYKYAFSLLRQAEYDRAEAAFSEFITLYADDPLSGNARYWLGETHYVRGQYVKAAEVFLAAYQGDPKGSKAPDTLLKLGMSLGNLDKKSQACASFDKLEKDYPKASPVILGKVKSERQKNGCK